MVITSCFIALLLFLDLTDGNVRYAQIRASRHMSEGENFTKSKTPILPIHRLSECPNNEESFKYNDDCELREVPSSGGPNYFYNCSQFTQTCYMPWNKTLNIKVEFKCTGYTRTCDTKGCQDSYKECKIKSYQDPFTEKTIYASGVPAKVIPECIPGVEPLRDFCMASYENCTARWNFSDTDDYLQNCKLRCSESLIKCHNYTRSCSNEVIRAYNTSDKMAVLTNLEELDCTFSTTERLRVERMQYCADCIDENAKTKNGSKVKGAMELRWVYEIEHYPRDESWGSCSEAAYVPYNLQCNQYITNMIHSMNYTVFEPHSQNLTNGILHFLSHWEGGYEVLCKWDCFYHLIKFSRICWPKIPLQRFLPGIDYRQLELLLRNMTRIACYHTKPPEQLEGIFDSYSVVPNEGSCTAFFDVEHNLTKPHIKELGKHCSGNCTKKCNEALQAMSSSFGCCLGSIVYFYQQYADWLKLLNFYNQPVIEKLLECKTTLERRCDLITPTSVSIDVVTYLMCVIGAFMGVVVIIMIISFYWQLEHEPLKKNFYHF